MNIAERGYVPSVTVDDSTRTTNLTSYTLDIAPNDGPIGTGE